GGQHAQRALQVAIGVARFGEGVEAVRAGVDVGIKALSLTGIQATGQVCREVVVNKCVFIWAVDIGHNGPSFVKSSLTNLNTEHTESTECTETSRELNMSLRNFVTNVCAPLCS